MSRLGGNTPLLFFGGVVIVIFYNVLRAVIAHSQSTSNVMMSVLITAVVVTGAVVAGSRIKKLNAGIAPNINTLLGASAAFAGVGYFDDRKTQFLSFSSGIVCIYLIAYFFALDRIPIADSIGGWVVAGVTAVTLGVQMFFCFRYASYVQMVVALHFLVGARRKNSLPDSGVALIGELRNSVFRDEQMYEPPGNIFVTMGITATFLGLAIGLSNLDLTAITQGIGTAANAVADNASTMDGDNVTAMATVGGKDLSSLVSFIGCMGLALGVSMLGVLMSMAAQWLRGYGPAMPTETILSRATEIVEGMPATHPGGH